MTWPGIPKERFSGHGLVTRTLDLPVVVPKTQSTKPHSVISGLLICACVLERCAGGRRRRQEGTERLDEGQEGEERLEREQEQAT